MNRRHPSTIVIAPRLVIFVAEGLKPFWVSKFFAERKTADGRIKDSSAAPWHSHISLLIDMGFSAVAIAERVGHESIDITYRYAHLFPTRQTDMVQQLELKRAEGGF